MASINSAATAASVALFGLVALCGGAGLWAELRLDSALEDSNRSASLLRSHLTADMMHDAVRSDVLAALMSRNPASGIEFAAVRADFAEHIQEFRAMIQAEGALAQTEAEREAVDSVAAPLEAYISSAEQVIALAERDPDAALAALPGFFEQFRTLEDSMEVITGVISASAAETTASAERDTQLSFWLVIAALAISAAAVIALALLTRRKLVAPLMNLTGAMTRVAGGDNSVDPPEAKREDEIGAMGKALISFREAALKRLEAERREAEARKEAAAAQERAREEAKAAAEALVTDSFGEGMAKLATGDLTYRLVREVPPAYEQLRANFNTAVEQLQDAMRSVVTNANGIRTGANEISQAADDLSRRTEQQAASLEETAAALDEVTATVRKTAEGTTQASSVVSTTSDDAAASGKIVRDTVAAMSEIERSANQISQIIGVIDEIAFQTNLLALNAGVEAARAGEAGRGFAVVASEVRALAQRSSDAAKEIKSLISASSRHVGAGVELVGEAGKALQQIAGRVTEMSALVNEIAASAQEQSTALAQVNTAVNQMDQVTQQNAAMVEQSTAASHSLRQEADNLMMLISRFKTGEPVAMPAAKPHPPKKSAKAQPQVKAPPKAAQRQRAASFSTAGSAALARAEDDWEEF
ncbi:MAG TPA: methyl-accepting chemotaxis protein [Vitreimonas sp.]|uniref:methyl-accepting chemotaxis protein n=1 Tax=Vitreimonas sp. TaxID=3069702 RepID=UPI002D49E4CB|nr:methyl-accepting chemotaxis protein [Vitreimonas sp.]HYD88802.1 methyl-accepting chemotaxis protein [Vitreimonas sp.]